MLALSSTLAVGIGLPIEATTASNQVSRRFGSCSELSKVWSNAIGRDDRSRTRYIKYQRDNYYKDTHVMVRAGVYRRNSHLDADRDGVLCEEYFEQRDGIRWAFGAIECVMGGGNPQSDGTCRKS